MSKAEPPLAEGTRELDGRRVVLTRPLTADPTSLTDRLRALGAAVDHVPLIEITEAPDAGAALAAALARLDEFDWLVVTSGHGARRVGHAARHHPRVRLAAVGDSTAAVLAELAGRPVDLVPARQRTEGLLEVFPRSSSAVLLAQANLAADDLASGLRAQGHRVVAIEAYITSLRPPDRDDLERLAGADAVVLASGSAVRSWLEAAGGAGLADGGAPRFTRGAVVTIGPKTAAVARDHGVDVTAVAATPSDDAVIAAIVGALRDAPE